MYLCACMLRTHVVHTTAVDMRTPGRTTCVLVSREKKNHEGATPDLMKVACGGLW